MTTAIIQARTGSSRLPGKVLKDVIGRPLLAHVVERVQAAETLDAVVVATSVEAGDDPIEALCAELGVRCERGSEADVLDRYYRAAEAAGADPVIRITADCPLIDPGVIDRVVAAFHEGGCDYASNTHQRTYPDGLDTEVFSFATIERAWREADLTSEREHVTPFIWKRPDVFTLRHVTQAEDHSDLRWTVDEPEDLVFVRRVYERLYAPERAFSMDDILALLRSEPRLADVNAGFDRNEGYQRSVERDQKAS